MERALSAIRGAIQGGPFEGNVWLVGGSVRDALLGVPASSDVDLVTERSSEELATLLFEKGVSSMPPVVYPRFGTARVQVEGTAVEIVTARRESYRTGSRKPKVEPATLKEDALRRDFTVNALLRNLDSGELFDPLETGLKDLESRLLRTPLEPSATFAEDPLRMLRAVRFRWQLGFQPAPGLYEAIAAQAESLRTISAERINEEFTKMLALEEADGCLQDLLDTGLLGVFAPELAALEGLEQGPFHDRDAWKHTLAVVRGVPKEDLVLRLAALFHDVAKPLTQTVESDGRIRFLGHERVGASLAEKVLRRLKYSNDVVREVGLLVRHHMRPGAAHKWSKPAVRRLMRDLGESLGRLLELAKADREAHAPGADVSSLALLEAQLRKVQVETPLETLQSPLTGSDLQELLGIGPGIEVGKWKRRLVREVIEGRIAPGDQGAARAFVLSKLNE